MEAEALVTRAVKSGQMDERKAAEYWFSRLSTRKITKNLQQSIKGLWYRQKRAINPFTANPVKALHFVILV